MRSAVTRYGVVVVLTGVTIATVGCSRIREKGVAYPDESAAAQVDDNEAEALSGEQPRGESTPRDAAPATPEGLRAAGGEPVPNANADNVEAEALDLVRSVMGQSAGTPAIDEVSATPEAGRVRVTGHFGDGTGERPAPTPRRFSAVVDCEHGFVCLLSSTDPPIARVKVTGNDSARAEGERFLREQFLEWSDLTRLTTETHKESGAHVLVFANVLESGAWTGAWCSAIIDDRPEHPDDFMKVEAVTATGRAVLVEKEAESARWTDLLVARHPYLESFVEAPSCALFRIEIVRFFHVVRLRPNNC